MADGRGYLLPPGETDIQEFDCTLVFYPKHENYRRALLGSLDYLGTWVAWEKDADKRGRGAARAWKAANELTIGCWQMACLETLQNNVAAILALLQGKKDCCDDSITFLPQPTIDSDIVPGVGSPPATYAGEPISDWDDWQEHVCYNAHAYVDYLKNSAAQMQAALGQGAVTIGIIATLIGLLSFSGIGLPIAFALAASVLGGLGGASLLLFANTEAEIEAARDAIVCAIINGDSIADEVSDAIGSGSAEWLLFFQWVDYSSAQAIMHEGGVGSDYLPSDTSTECDCETPTGIYLNGALANQYYSKDGGPWLSLSTKPEIVYGSTYRIQGPAGQTQAAISITDIDDGYASANVTLDTNLGAGNGLYWTVQKQDGSYCLQNALRTVPGGYPITCTPCRYFGASGNPIGYGSAYWITVVATPG